MAILTPKDSSGGPGVCIFLAIGTKYDELRSLPGRPESVILSGVAIGGRQEGGKLTRQKRLEFTKPAEFWAWLNTVRHPRERTWLVSDRLTIDLTLLGFWGLLDEGKFTLRRARQKSPSARSRAGSGAPVESWEHGILVTEDPPTAVECWSADGWGLTCIDLRNWIPYPVSTLAEWDGKTLPTDDPGLIGPPNWPAILGGRAEVVRDAFCRVAGWWDDREFGKFGLTVTSSALKSFAKYFIPEWVYAPQDEEQRALERSGAFVGRCEALWVGNVSSTLFPGLESQSGGPDADHPPPAGPFHLLDASSFYGYCCLDAQLPVETLEIWREGASGEIALESIGPDCMASVLISHPTERFPYRGDQGIYWPTGEYQTTLCGVELARAIRVGAVAHISWAIRYRMADWMSDLAAHFWTEAEMARMAGNRVIQQTAKNILARIGGKFAQSGQSWQDRPERIPPEPWAHWSEINTTDGTMKHFRAISWHVQERIPGEDPPHCWPAVFAFLTAYGRETLYRWMETAGPGNVLYCATDALIVTEEGRRRLDEAGFICPGALGFLRPVESANSLEIRGAMAYRIGSKVCLAGRPLIAREVEPGVWVSAARPTLREILSRRGGESIPNRENRMTLGPRTAWGSISPNGWITPPRLGPAQLVYDLAKCLPIVSPDHPSPAISR